MAFLHGVETVVLTDGVRPVTINRSAVIGLIGVSPVGPVETPTLITSESDAAQFGALVPSFTIPQALDAIFQQGAGTIIAVNVFNPATMTTPVVDEAATTANGKTQTDFPPIGATIIVTDDPETETFVDGVDYTFDEFGEITILDFVKIPNGTDLLISYNKFDETAITPAVIAGAVSVANVRTGLKAFDDSYQQFGFDPTIFIAPEYVETEANALELTSTAESFRGFALIDAPVGTTKAEALAGRGPAGTINFNTASSSAVLLFPHLQAINGKTSVVESVPFSSYFAGLWVNSISTNGIEFSPSNKTISGIVGIEQPISFRPTQAAGTDANELNAAGIITVGNSFGTGFVTWGNRSALYPSQTIPENFLPVQLVAYVVDKSIEAASVQFLDLPALPALIDAIKETVNGFLRTLIARGALVDGECTFLASDNPVEQTGAGQLVFNVVIMPPTPAERITIKRFVDINLLTALTA